MGLFEIITTANHNLLRNKARTILTILAIFVGSFTIALNSAINTGVNKFIDDQTASLGGEDYIMIMPEGAVEGMSSLAMGGASGAPTEYNPDKTMSAFTDEQLNKLKELDGINGELYVTKNYVVDYITSAKTDKKYNINVMAMPPGDFNIAMTAGSLPNRDSKKYEIALQSGYPKALGFDSDEDAIGKTVTITVRDAVTKKYKNFEATVVGIQAPGVVAVNGSVITVSLQDALYDEVTKYYPDDQKSMVYSVQTKFDTSKYTESEIKAILEENGFYGFTISDMMGMIRTFFDVIMIVFTIFGAIALVAAAIGIINTLLMSVEERTREIGLDKALGMSSTKIFLNFSFEAIALGFWGSAVGVGVAMLVGNLANTVVHQPGGFLEAFPTFHLFNFTLQNVLPIIIIVMVIAFVAGTVPAWKAAHKNPIDALRYE